ncbi:hypothetical protein ACF09J_35710 [Streptomyces sp. NPDC014889]|uniref:hypothetical protein n=1 Tax=Streptomyces sp. NPDC014889 TaxID=3364928 RepID=UPI0036F68625
MTTIDNLLSQSLLLQDPVPSDLVPYEDTAYPALPTDGTPLWGSCEPGPIDDTAARHLHALCEAAVARCNAEQLVDFVTDQLPGPRAAWVLG